MFTNNRELGYDVTEILSPTLFEPTSDEIQEVQDSGNALLLGSTLRTSTAVGRTATVKPGEDIRPALNSLKSAGGGTLILLAGTHRPTYDIVGTSKISIIGEGVDQTIIDFGGGAYSIKYIGTALSIIENFKLADFTVRDSNATASIDIDYADFWSIKNVRATQCDQSGFRWKHAQQFSVSDTTAIGNVSNGFISLGGESTRPTNYFVLSNLFALDNSGIGFYFTQDDAGGNGHAYGTVISCFANSNVSHGIAAENCSIQFVNCQSDLNSGDGFQMTSDFSYLVSCSATFNSGYGFQLDTSYGLIAPFSFSNTTGNYDIQENSDINVLSPLAVASTSYTNTVEKVVRIIRNTSGGALTAGNVVILKSVANAEEITTTTTVGDDKVWGIVLNAASSNGPARVLLQGETTLLTVNGTTDIAVGDFLATHSVAGIAAKAAAGDMAFAIALEAYTTDDSNGVIDALIIKPRKI